jgi:hypothetical protein
MMQVLQDELVKAVRINFAGRRQGDGLLDDQFCQWIVNVASELQSAHCRSGLHEQCTTCGVA